MHCFPFQHNVKNQEFNNCGLGAIRRASTYSAEDKRIERMAAHRGNRWRQVCKTPRSVIKCTLDDWLLNSVARWITMNSWTTSKMWLPECGTAEMSSWRSESIYMRIHGGGTTCLINVFSFHKSVGIYRGIEVSRC